jgi:hypothetical protein
MSTMRTNFCSFFMLVYCFVGFFSSIIGKITITSDLLCNMDSSFLGYYNKFLQYADRFSKCIDVLPLILPLSSSVLFFLTFGGCGFFANKSSALATLLYSTVSSSHGTTTLNQKELASCLHLLHQMR